MTIGALVSSGRLLPRLSISALIAKERAFAPRNIKVGFAAGDLVLFNLDRLLRDMLKSTTTATIPIVNTENVGPCLRDQVPQTPVTPVPPATPV